MTIRLELVPSPQMSMSRDKDLTFKSNQKAVGYSHDIHVATVQVGMSCQVSHDCSLHGSQLGEIDDYFLLW